MEVSAKLTLFGTPRLLINEEEISLGRRQAVALLAYLSLEKGTHVRDSMASLLWPNVPIAKARVSLRTTLSSIKKKLGDDFLVINHKTIGLAPQTSLWIDLEEFQTAVAAYLRHHPNSTSLICEQCVETLEKGLALVEAPFMFDFSLKDNIDFSMWQTHWQQELLYQLEQTISSLFFYAQTHKDHEKMLAYTRQWVSIDKYNEAAHRQLMQLYLQVGQRPLALHHYLTLSETFETELGISLEPETRALYEELSNSPNTNPAPAVWTQINPTRISQIPHNLPVQLTRFIGRTKEIEEIVERLEKPHCHLLTISGPGGMGKSRLALEVGHILRPLFRDGVYFIPLAPLDNPERITPAIAEAVNFRFYGRDDNKSQLQNFLSEKEILLIVDNFEHITAGKTILVDIMQAAPQVKLLITSRESLNLQAEWLFEIDGLPYPTNGECVSAESSTAVELFIERAQQSFNKFTVTPQTQPVINQICRFVQGTPLAIELLAPRVKNQTIHQIAQELEHDINVLQTTMLDIPERHRSIRAVFDQSWQLLKSTEKDVLKKLAFFPGSFSYTAAKVVTAATRTILDQLVNKSLIKQNSTTRYEMHELIKQFAIERLETRQQQSVADKHSRFYAEFLAHRNKDLQSGELVQMLEEIAIDLENIRSAWNWAINHHQEETIQLAMEPLYHFYRASGLLAEGIEIYATAVARLSGAQENLSHLSVEQQAQIGRLLAYQSWFCWSSGSFTLAEEMADKAIGLLQPVDDKHYLAFIYNSKTSIAIFQHKDYSEAMDFYQKSLQLYQDLNDQLGIVGCLNNYATLFIHTGNIKQAERSYLEAAVISKSHRFQEQYARSILNLGLVYELSAQYEKALNTFQEAYILCEQLQNKYGMAISLINQCEVTLRMNKFEEAEKLCQKQIQLSRDIGDVHLLIGGMIAQGNIYYMRQAYAEASQLLQKSLDLAQSYDSNYNIVLVLAQIARLFYWLEKHEASWALLTAVTPHLQHSTHHLGHPENLAEHLAVKLPAEQYQALQTRWQNRPQEEAIELARSELNTLN